MPRTPKTRKTPKPKAAVMTTRDVARELQKVWKTAPYVPGGIWKAMAAKVLELARDGRLPKPTKGAK